MNNLQIKLSSLNFTSEQKHSNIMHWEGAISKIDIPSDDIPYGASYPVVLTRKAVESNYKTIINMPLNCVWDDWNPAWALTGHDGRFVIGSVLEAWVDGENYMAKGIIYKDNFPDVAYMIQNAKDALGFSVELYVKNKEVKEEVEYINDVEFTGLCVCYSNLAAFEDTFLTKIAASKKKKEVDTMDEKQLTAAITAAMEKFTAGINEKFNTVEEKLTKIEAEKQEKEAAEKVAQEVERKEEFEKLKATNAELESKLAELNKTPERKSLAGYQVVERFENGDINYEAEMEKINASKMTIEQKIKARAELGAKVWASKQK